ncbi:MAG: hypothetical protein AAFV88_01595 [Planctomycetota bacterium]
MESPPTKPAPTLSGKLVLAVVPLAVFVVLLLIRMSLLLAGSVAFIITLVLAVWLFLLTRRGSR